MDIPERKNISSKGEIKLMAINAFQEELCDFLKELHSGEESAIHSRELEKVFAVTGSKLRFAINQLRSQGCPICSSDAGYYFADTQNEIERTIQRLNASISAMSRARDGLLSANLLFKKPVCIRIKLEIRRKNTR